MGSILKGSFKITKDLKTSLLSILLKCRLRLRGQDVARDCVFLTSAQVVLMLLVEEHHIEE